MKKILFLVLGFFASPLAIGILEGINKHFWINLVLWLLSCSVLGIGHAWYLILTKDYPATRG
ncbi:MAG: YqaE/Pmp3 family membrane protein [Candidatus Sumerlaeia bacterium]|nr:YqaE/Pmp3 family membrane protein [Candidatus Sumerlaeia bacterium]